MNTNANVVHTKSTSTVSLRLAPELVDELDTWAREQSRTRNGMIRFLLLSALDRSRAERSGATHEGGEISSRVAR